VPTSKYIIYIRLLTINDKEHQLSGCTVQWRATTDPERGELLDGLDMEKEIRRQIHKRGPHGATQGVARGVTRREDGHDPPRGDTRVIRLRRHTVEQVINVPLIHPLTQRGSGYKLWNFWDLDIFIIEGPRHVRNWKINKLNRKTCI